jgi:RHS repeat-associated protein
MVNSDIGFKGDVSDLQLNRTRWYDPAVGRWLNEDPVGFNAHDANFTSYVSPRQTPPESTVASEKG